MILLDTNVVSELRKAREADRGVMRWIATQAAELQFLSAISILELEIGVQRMERRDARQGAVLRRWLNDRVHPAFEDRILPVDLAVARRCAALHVPDPRPERDAMIVATALVHGLTLATRNETDFQNMGVQIINPWTG